VDGSDCSEKRKVVKRKSEEKANNTSIDLVTKSFKVFSTNATDKVQIFKDLVTIIDKKAIVEYDVIHLRDEHKKYKEIKTQLRMRK